MGSALLACLVAAFAVAFTLASNGYVRVHEGQVGILFRGGALMPNVLAPGFHSLLPWIDRLEQVPVGMQTLKVEQVPCGTSGGVLVAFSSVEVVFRLGPADVWGTVKNYSTSFAETWVRDPIHHEVNQVCSQHSLNEVVISKFSELSGIVKKRLEALHAVHCPGIQVVAVRLSKPDLPESVRRNFLEVATKEADLRTVAEREAVVLAEASTARALAGMEARKLLDVAELDAATALARAGQQAAIDAVASAAEAATIRGAADARAYHKRREAAANAERFTPPFLALQRAQALARNTEYYWGNAVPRSIILDNTHHQHTADLSHRSRGHGERESGEERLIFEAAAAISETQNT